MPPWPRRVVFCALFVGAVMLVYWPALRGGFVWDDDQYVTENLTLRHLSGLEQIWFKVGATPQYYPLVYTSFWLEYHLWGLEPLGFHLVNVMLHALAALLLGCVLGRLQVPGAWLAAALFALHPVMVESVAWVTERKNVLSAVFYFAAALAYLRYGQGMASDTAELTEVRPGGTKACPATLDARRSTLFYALALGLFVAALLSKTVACSLPATLLLVCYWKQGRLRQDDILPLLPFFAIGASLGLLTAWVEKHHVGAQGAEWSLTFADRCLIAGRALWFYAGKLIWPAHLTFIYPRWTINPATWWQWVFPAAAAGMVTTLWWLRNRIGRGPLVSALFFAGTLGPALGFVNVYPMRFSFVADHFQYLAAVGLITLCAVALTRLPQIIPLMLVALLGILTWRQAENYRDIETLWRTTINRNPNCWMAYSNLGDYYHIHNRLDEALVYYRKAVEADPEAYEPLTNVGLVLAARGRWDEAMEYYRRALRACPIFYKALNNLGLALAAQGRLDEAIEYYHQALRANPHSYDVLNNLAAALATQGHLDEAIEYYRRAFQEALSDVGLDPTAGDRLDETIARYRQPLAGHPIFHKVLNNLGLAFAAQGRLDEAIEYYHLALRINPNAHDTLNNLGAVFAAEGRWDEAIENYRRAIQAKPDYDKALDNLGFAFAAQGRWDEAMEQYRKAIQSNPGSSKPLNDLGLALAAQGRLKEAIENFQKAIQIDPGHAETFVGLGMALAQSGRTREAAVQYRAALKINPDLAGALNNLAWILAASPEADLRDGAEAIRLAERACELTHDTEPMCVGTLAAAYAEAGRFPEAAATAEKAAQLADQAGLTDLASKNRQLLELYRAGKPYHESPPPKP